MITTKERKDGRMAVSRKELTLDQSESQITERAIVRGVPGPIDLIAPSQPPTITTILAAAVDKGMEPEALDKLLAVFERMQAATAAREAFGDLAKFQSDCPVIKTTDTATIVTTSGGQFTYKYAPLDEIANTIRPHLEKHGLSYAWDSDLKDGQLLCVCTVRHVNGHAFAARFSCPTASPSKMSDAQKHAAALTFARRQSLIQALGLTTGEPDTDGGDNNPAKISEHQAANLQVMLDEVKGDKPRFLKWLNVASLADIRAVDFRRAIDALEAKRKGAQ